MLVEQLITFQENLEIRLTIFLFRLFQIKKKIDAIVTNIGPPNVNETTSARGNSLNPKKRAMIARAPLIALKACKPGREVL